MIREVVSNGDGVHQTGFTYKGTDVVAQFDKDGSGALTAADESHVYLTANGRTLADEQFAPTTGGYDRAMAGTVNWLLPDQIGSTRDIAVLNTQTGVTSKVTHIDYDSFGKVEQITNEAVESLFGFAGMVYDKASETNVSMTRRYRPAARQWDGKDWISFDGRQTNLSQYVGNGPTYATDPTGCATPEARQLLDYFAAEEHAPFQP